MSVPVTVGVLAATILIGTPTVFAGAALEARHRAASAADSAALAAADAMLGFISGEPCERAEAIANAHRVALESCEVGVTDAWVTTRSSGPYGTVSQRARAGIPHSESAVP